METSILLTKYSNFRNFSKIMPYVRFIWKIIHVSKYEKTQKTQYQYIEMRFFAFWNMDNFLDETGIIDEKS